MKIRLENENDYLEVENLVRNSFWNIYRPGAFEHYIVHQLREDESFIANLAFVIEDNGKIVGHINYSWGYIDWGDEKTDAAVLGPIAIDRKCQNSGLGSRLIEHTLGIAENLNIPFIMVIGDENYYRRFGFESASKYNLYLVGTDTTDECPFFMVKLLEDFEFENKRGIFHNPEVFDVDQCEVDKFDEQFEYKEKLVLEGQLGEIK